MSTLTTQESIDALNKSTLPTIFVEGYEDIIYHRYLERTINEISGGKTISVWPCGNRPELIKIFRRRSEITSVPIAFICDQDTWIIKGQPLEFRDIITHEGYSVENQLSIILPYESLMDNAELANFNALMSRVINYYSYAYEIIYSGGTPKISLHCDDVPATTPTPPCPHWLGQIQNNYKYFIQGHCLYSAYEKILDATNRPTRYSKRHLMEMSIRLSSDYTLKQAEKILGRLYPAHP